MTLVENPTVTSAAEAHVLRTQGLANDALTNLKATAVECFRRLWRSDIPAADQIAVMGTEAAAAFDQHYRTVVFLLQSGVTIDPADYTPPLEYKANDDGTITLA